MKEGVIGKRRDLDGSASLGSADIRKQEETNAIR